MKLYGFRFSNKIIIRFEFIPSASERNDNNDNMLYYRYAQLDLI